MRTTFATIIVILAVLAPSASALEGEDDLDGKTTIQQSGEASNEPPPADPDTGFGSGTITAQNDHGEANVTRTRTYSDTNLVAVVDANVGADGSGASPVVAASAPAAEPDDTADEADPTPGGPDCSRYSPGYYDAETDTSYSGACVRWRVCGAERVDDVASGRISGVDSVGRYREYIDQIGGYILSDTGVVPGADLTTINSVSDFTLSQGLGDAPGIDLLPIFYWCADRDENYVFDPIDPTSVRFEWSLNYDDVYDIDRARNQLYGEITTELNLYQPEIGLRPPAEIGYTFVRWTTWMFLDNPPAELHNYTTNDLDTLRIDVRATVVDVTWTFADETIKTCTVDEMVPFDELVHDAVDDLPPCHYRFNQFGYADLVTTVRYKIEEQIRTRPSSTGHQYSPGIWTDFLGAPTEVELTTTLADYEVHEIWSVNVPIGMSREEIIANARANGQIPDIPKLSADS